MGRTELGYLTGRRKRGRKVSALIPTPQFAYPLTAVAECSLARKRSRVGTGGLGYSGQCTTMGTGPQSRALTITYQEVSTNG